MTHTDQLRTAQDVLDLADRLKHTLVTLAKAPLPRSCYAGPNAQALKAWIAKHMPELDAELGPMKSADVRARLNALTGAGVRSCDTIEDGSKRFLAALQDLSGEP